MPAMMVALMLATALQSASPVPGITRTVLKTTATLEVARIEYAPGVAEPPGNHGYDVVLVPITGTMTAEVDGVPARWEPGLPILISRGAPHQIENRSARPARFFEVRTLGDNPAGVDRVADARGATIARSMFDKYVRATVWRLDPGGYVEWPADMDQVLIVKRAQQVSTRSAEAQQTELVTLVDDRSVSNRTGDDEEVVRVSRMASR